jgi:two-component system response regulator RegA
VSTRPSIRRLLLVDDDPVFCQALGRALTARDFAVDKVEDGASALRLAEDRAPDVAIVELRLPDMSGLRVLARLRAIDANTQIVVLTAFGSIATAILAIKLGAVHYLTKPSSIDEILAAFDNRAPDLDGAVVDKPLSVERIEWEHIQRVLTNHGGNVSATARALNMHRRTLQRKLYKRPPGH